MALYTYKCPSCFQTKEVLQSIKEDSPVCMRCANASCGVHLPEMKRVFGDVGKPQFKGSGFYETDYRTDKEKGKPYIKFPKGKNK